MMLAVHRGLLPIKYPAQSILFSKGRFERIPIVCQATCNTWTRMSNAGCFLPSRHKVDMDIVTSSVTSFDRKEKCFIVDMDVVTSSITSLRRKTAAHGGYRLRTMSSLAGPTMHTRWTSMWYQKLDVVARRQRPEMQSLPNFFRRKLSTTFFLNDRSIGWEA